MTATELAELVKDLPAEALCEGLHFTNTHWGWIDQLTLNAPLSPERAAALQRDAMTEWLSTRSKDAGGIATHYKQNDKKQWSVVGDMFFAHESTRLHALAEAVRYVAGQRSKE